MRAKQKGPLLRLAAGRGREENCASATIPDGLAEVHVGDLSPIILVWLALSPCDDGELPDLDRDGRQLLGMLAESIRRRRPYHANLYARSLLRLLRREVAR